MYYNVLGGLSCSFFWFIHMVLWKVNQFCWSSLYLPAGPDALPSSLKIVWVWHKQILTQFSYASRWTAINTRAYVASMEFQDTQLFSGFQKDPWSPKSEPNTIISSLRKFIHLHWWFIEFFVEFFLVTVIGMKGHVLLSHLLSLLTMKEVPNFHHIQENILQLHSSIISKVICDIY